MKKAMILVLAIMILPVAIAAEEQLFSGEGWLVVKDGEVHQISLMDVTVDGDSCGIMFDEEIYWIDVGASETIDGIYIKVFEAYPVHSQTQDNDACQVFISGTLTKEYQRPFIVEVQEEPEEIAEPELYEEEKEETGDNETEAEPADNNETIQQEPEESKGIWQRIVEFFRNLFS